MMNDPLERRRFNMEAEEALTDEPVYVISVAARMIGVHQQTLRTYEREGLIEPARSNGRVRMYSDADIARLRTIRRLVDELGVNLAGAGVILNLTQRMAQMQEEVNELRAELQRQRDRHLPVPRDDGPSHTPPHTGPQRTR